MKRKIDIILILVLGMLVLPFINFVDADQANIPEPILIESRYS